MAYDPARHRRRSIRLPSYDYAAPGWYFVTICVQHRACLFGEVAGETVRLSPAGRIVQAAWDDLPNHYPNLVLDAFVVMPNHVHGILGLTAGAAEPDGATGTDGVTGPDGANGPDGVGAPLVGARPEAELSRHRAGTRPAPTLGDIVGAFKSRTTNAYIRGIRTQDWPPFDRRLWQRNYWERVLRNERELTLARDYVVTNPLRWHLDRLHPDRRPW